MSGIGGIVWHGAGVRDRAALATLLEALRARGPDGTGEWVGERAGLVHAQLRTTFESHREAEPSSLDGDLTITADARIDDRVRLCGELRGAGQPASADDTDPRLILLAYRAWGSRCVEHLLGDFAFAIWDDGRRRLFCARDHFGVKPFFYRPEPAGFAFANSLEALRALPGGERLDDLAVADFLLFDELQDPGATIHAAIRRLPPAHALEVGGGDVEVRRYWTLDRAVEIRHRGDPLERFNAVLQEAVSDRLRTHDVCVSLSGGLDSPAIAAAAKRALDRSGRPFALTAHTLVYDREIPDEERRYASLAASGLGLPIRCHAADGYGLYEGVPPWPEPFHEPQGGASFALVRAQAADARVSLMGWDGDALLNESPKPWLRRLVGERRYGRAALAAARFALMERRLLPHRWTSASTSRDFPQPRYPDWIQPDLERSLGLRERWRAVQAQAHFTHPVRPYAYRILEWLGRWSSFFERFDPGATGLPIEFRHPFLDLRFVELCLSLPPVPWCVRKHVLRESLRGAVPKAVRLRPKTPLPRDAGFAMLEREDARWIDEFIATPALHRYICRDKLPRLWRPADPASAWQDLRPLTLDRWLRQRITHTARKEIAA